MNRLLAALARLWRRPGTDLSFSRAVAFLACPWKYKLIYLDGWRAPPNSRTSLGLSVHRALEDFYRGEARTLEALQECYNERWLNEGYETPQDALETYERGLRMLEDYFRATKDLPGVPVMLEQAFEFALGPHRVKGVIDRVDRLPDGSHEIIDYKTHAEAWSPARARADLQMTVYRAGARRALGIAPSRFSFHFIAAGKMVPTERTARDEAEALRLLRRIGDDVVRGRFAPDTSHCRACDFRRKCVHAKV